MPKSIEILEAEVLSLPTAERSRLLDRLIASLDSDLELQEAWLQEAARRDAEIDDASAPCVPGEPSLARLRAGLR